MPKIKDPAKLQQLGAPPVGGFTPITGPKAPNVGVGYAAPGAPAVSYVPGSGEDPNVIRQQEMARAGVQLSKEAAAAQQRMQLNLAEDQIKRQRDAARAGGGSAFEPTSALRKELESQTSVKAYKNAIASYASAMRAADKPAGDLNVIYAYAKILDPDSVVREGEQASVAGLGPVGQRIDGELRKQLNGEGKLAPELRRSIMNEMRNRVSAYDQGYNAERARFRDLASRQGIDPSLVVGAHIGDAYAKDENKFWRGDENLDAVTFNKRQREAAARGEFYNPGGMDGGGSGGGGGGPSDRSLSTGQFRTEMDTDTNAMVDRMIRQGMSAGQINSVIGAERVQEGDVKAAQDLLRKFPDYQGGFAVSTKQTENNLLNQVAGSPAGTFVGSAADNMIGGLSDELGAGVQSTFGAGNYSDNLANLDAAKQGAYAANPASAIGGGVLGSAASFLTGSRLLGGAGQALGRSAPYVGSIAQGAITGAGQNNDNRALGGLAGGALGAAGYGLGELASIPAGALLRTQAGQAVNNAASRLPGVGRFITPDVPTATPSLGDRGIAGAAVDPAAIRTSLGEAGGLGVPMSLADTIPQMTSLAGQAVRRSPNADQIAQNAFFPRARGQIDRFGQAVERDLGPVGNIPQLSADLGEQAKAAASPLYEAAYAANPIRTPEIDSLLGTPFGRSALGRANTIAANERRNPMDLGFSLDDSGNVVLNPVNVDMHGSLASARTAYDDGVASAQSAYDNALSILSNEQRRARGGAARGSSVAEAQKSLESARSQLDRAISNTGPVDDLTASLSQQPTPGMAASTPGYTPQTLDYVKRGMDDVLEQYRNPITNKLVLDESGRAQNGVLRSFLGEVDRLNPAYGQARAAYAGPASSRDALARGQDAFTMEPNTLGMQVANQTPEHLSQMQLGYRSALMNRANKVRDVANPFEATLATPYARAQIDTLYPGNPGNATLFRQRDMEQGLARTTNDILGNSKTAQRQIADESFLNPGNMAALGADAASVALGGLPLASAARAATSRGLGQRAKDALNRRAVKKADELAPILFNTDPAASAASLDDILSRVNAYQDFVQTSRPRRKLGMFGGASGMTLANQY